MALPVLKHNPRPVTALPIFISNVHVLKILEPTHPSNNATPTALHRQLAGEGGDIVEMQHVNSFDNGYFSCCSSDCEKVSPPGAAMMSVRARVAIGWKASCLVWRT
jgi:hypothetical protein